MIKSTEVEKIDSKNLEVRIDSENDEISFLHSALCTMSLPIRRPKDEFAPLLRQDGRYSMVLQPKPYPDGQGGLVQVGVPFGAKARLVLIHIMTEAVRTSDPEIYLGKSLSDWMRRMGYTSFSGGPSGTMTLFKNQVLRLSRCDWTIRREMDSGEGATLTDVKLTDDLCLWSSSNGEFVETLTLNQRFFEHLKDHAVPLSERALFDLRDNPTALDLYVWLVYRLPRLNKMAILSWKQMARHFGNDYKNIRQFRHELRKILPKVLDAYPEAKIDLSEGLVKLYPSPTAIKTSRMGYRLSTITPKITPKNNEEKVVKTPVRETGVLANGKIKKELLKTLLNHMDSKTINTWFKEMLIIDSNTGFEMEFKNGFYADYIKSNFSSYLELCFNTLGLDSMKITHK